MRRFGLAVTVFLTSLLAGAPSSAASLTLSPQQIQAAIRFGQRSIVSEEFDREWRMANAAGETLKVVTPFFRLAQAARNAAFKSEELKQREIEGLLKEHEGKLFFWAYLRGKREDFSRWYAPVLVLQGKPDIKPSFVQNERTPLRQADGHFLSRCVYAFPASDLNGKDRVTLVVRDHEDHEVATFTVDLSTMR